MKLAYLKIELVFEQLTSIATRILGNPITFILACILVAVWWSVGLFNSDNLHEHIGDFIFGTTFLSLFIIQKSFNRYSALVHLKMNELIASHETANNAVIDAGKKTEKEIMDLAKEYNEEGEQIEQQIEEEIAKENNKGN